MRLNEVNSKLNEMMEWANEGVRPPGYMIDLYNKIGKLPLRMGTALFFLTGIDTIKVAMFASRGKTDAAIQVLYNYRFRPWRLVWGLGDHLWQGAFNCRSVRSRGKFTREAVHFLLESISKSEKSNSNGMVTAVSIGAGSGSQMLQGVANNKLNGNGVRLILVDNDGRALERGRVNARNLGVEDLIETRELSIGYFLKTAEKCSVDLVEVVGLTDYFNDSKFSRYLEGIYNVLKDDGVFIGANISSKEEWDYAHNVACWPNMYYRSQESIIESLEGVGFKEVWTAQCGLYTFWIAQK